ncbi:bifunctional helix-turn-helix domain-containing protein/methylated-DNA--[protein]-cysteine S-methyltransferase [Halarcobacter anaerophilus]|jgi:AraC family transcriptional regulator of adaptative response/methylated-DNA-[protein]-cysteine methyltransferase|uniref:bifunctional helix-turn-helix domain-containing protein/methylated-DNA--[protein]-cysteine S-methyltransferase n=1 Tax=Halarcobacter anaerophilus TaxID=877500 RepID=UPI0005C9341E|nr:bifunctional helix-turn-helix domain-containing protein/methylated-DNA--[protein]-cysteine S-methyltransferase [Halarcobacter anaerophilus]
MNKLENKSRYYNDIKKAIEYFDENYSYQPKLDDVALYVGMSKHHFSRIFKEYVGVTPMQFLQATTLAHAKKKLSSSKSILDTSLDLGLSSSSRLHELFVNFAGVTPNEYKKMGEKLDITYGFGFSPFGKTMIASTKKGICSLEFYEDSYDEIFKRVKKTWNKAEFIHDDKKAQELLARIFINKEKMNLFVKGTNFQINVWRAILNLKSAEISTYSDVAQFIGKPKAVRAVATAIGSNQIGFLIPCHRVISKSAAMGGYRWGIDRKRVLLSYEENEKSKDSN